LRRSALTRLAEVPRSETGHRRQLRSDHLDRLRRPLINDRAPSIAEGVPRKIGGTDEHVFPLQQVRRDMFMLLKQQAEAVDPGLAKTWATYLDPADWHAAWGLPRSGRSIVQTGVLVLAPKHHRDLLEHVYYSYEDHGGEPMNYEMRLLSFEIQKQDLLHVFDGRFNALLIFLIMQKQMQLRRALTPDGCLAFVRLVMDQTTRSAIALIHFRF